MLCCHRIAKRFDKIAAVDTLGHLLALCVTSANEQDRAQVSELAERVQAETGETVEIAYVDQGYTGENAVSRLFDLGLGFNLQEYSIFSLGQP
jgi:hypothetical protein